MVGRRRVGLGENCLASADYHSPTYHIYLTNAEKEGQACPMQDSGPETAQEEQQQKSKGKAGEEGKKEAERVRASQFETRRKYADRAGERKRGSR